MNTHTKIFKTEYLPAIITGEEKINHKYIDRFLKHRNQLNYERNFITLKDAFDSYYWPNPDDNFSQNNSTLMTQQERIRNAIKLDEEETIFESIKNVLFWGAGNRKSKIYTSNVSWLDSQLEKGRTVKGILLAAQHAFESGNFEKSPPGNDTYRSNAGYTKVYSLMMDDFIIFDSRVAAALGLLVVNFCEKQGLDTIPEELLFGRASATGNDNRNPSKLDFKFPYIGNSHTIHARSNFNANLALKNAISTLKSKDQVPEWLDDNPLRHIEAALFMLGKDIPSDNNFSNFTNNHVSSTTSKNIQFEWTNMHTLSRGADFHFREDDDGNVEFIYGVQPGSPTDSTKGMHTINFSTLEKLVTNFEDKDAFELGTSHEIQQRPEGSLGDWYFKVTNDTTGIASYLGSYLVHKNVAEIVVKRPLALKILPNALDSIQTD